MCLISYFKSFNVLSKNAIIFYLTLANRFLLKLTKIKNKLLIISALGVVYKKNEIYRY